MSPDGIIHHPTVFKLGFLELTGFGLAVLLAFVIAQVVCQRELWRRGHDREADAMPDVTLAALPPPYRGQDYYVCSPATRRVFSRGASCSGAGSSGRCCSAGS